MAVKKEIYNPAPKATEERERTIRSRFDEFGCSERFDLLEIIDSKHVLVKCAACGNEFIRETSFLKQNKKATSNICCEKCGIHADGTYTSPRSENKRGLDDKVLVDYYIDGNSASATALHFGVNLRRVTRAVINAGVCRTSDVFDIADDYPDELTGDEFQDEVFICAECGREYTRHQYEVANHRKNRALKVPKYCSGTCRDRAFGRRYKHNMRRVRKEAETKAKIDMISLSDLIVRDNGICKLCGEPIDKNDAYFDADGNFHVGRLYPTIDHIVPLSKGGMTMWNNVQLAHLCCNSAKKDKVIA